MSDTVTISVTLHHETAGPRGAWLVSTNGKRESAQWVPKSQGSMSVVGMSTKLTLPRRMAVSKGLL
jgi:hypothetical protein